LALHKRASEESAKDEEPTAAATPTPSSPQIVWCGVPERFRSPGWLANVTAARSEQLFVHPMRTASSLRSLPWPIHQSTLVVVDDDSDSYNALECEQRATRINNAWCASLPRDNDIATGADADAQPVPVGARVVIPYNGIGTGTVEAQEHIHIPFVATSNIPHYTLSPVEPNPPHTLRVRAIRVKLDSDAEEGGACVWLLERMDEKHRVGITVQFAWCLAPHQAQGLTLQRLVVDARALTQPSATLRRLMACAPTAKTACFLGAPLRWMGCVQLAQEQRLMMRHCSVVRQWEAVYDAQGSVRAFAQRAAPESTCSVCGEVLYMYRTCSGHTFEACVCGVRNESGGGSDGGVKPLSRSLYVTAIYLASLHHRAS